MVLFISLLLAGIFAAASGKSLRRKAGFWYLVSLIISILIIAGVFLGWFTRLREPWLTLSKVFTQGGLAGAMFILVMYTGAFMPGTKPSRCLLPVRGQLSVIASILTLGHNIAYGKTYFVLLFTQTAGLKGNILAAAIWSLIMILIMLPLFVTSFLCIRKKMPPRKWKKLQRLAYLFYGLLYLHILLLNFPPACRGTLSANLNIALYSLVFGGYVWLRIRRCLYTEARKKTALELADRISVWHTALFAALLLLLLSVGTFQMINTAGQNETQKNNTTKEILPEEETQTETRQLLPEGRYIDGEYSGAGMGYNGRLTVSVTIKEGKIAEVKIKGSVDDEPYLTDVKEHLPAAIVAAGTPEVDAVSGATTTSHGLMEAVRDALSNASGQK